MPFSHTTGGLRSGYVRVPILEMYIIINTYLQGTYLSKLVLYGTRA